MRAVSRRERLLMVIGGVGLLALLVDRVWVAPDSAQAATLPGGLRPQRAAAIAAADLALNLPRPASAPAVPEDLPDVFLRTRLFPEGIAAAAVAAAPGSAVPPETDTFVQAHRLRGVVLGPRPLAVIDNRTLRVGDRIDGAVITAIRPKEVELARDGQRILLPLAADR